MIFKTKEKLMLEDLKKQSKVFLKSCIPIPGMKPDISDAQLKMLVDILDENGKF